MKIVLVTLALIAGFAGVRRALSPCSRGSGAVGEGASCCDVAPAAPAAETGLAGRFVEARTASVFAGACHYSGEYTTQGRRAVLGLRFESGTEGDVDLIGVAAVVAIAAPENLAAGGARRSVLFLDAELDERRAEAALAVCRREFGDVVGTIDGVLRRPLDVRIEGDDYRVRVGDAIELAGALDPDRACCSMPQNVWYRPLVESSDAIVGRSRRFAFDVDGQGAPFVRSDENNAFVGRFRWAASDRAAPAPSS